MTAQSVSAATARTPALAVPKSRSRLVSRIGQSIVIAFMLFWALGPVAWMLLTSIKPDSLVSVVPPVWIFQPTLSNYATLFGSADFQRYLVNTLIVASVTSVLATTFGFLSAYSFTRFRYRGSTFLPLFYLVVRMVPRISLVLPFYAIASYLGLLNTKIALI